MKGCQWNSEVLYPLQKGITSKELIGKIIGHVFIVNAKSKHPKQM